MNVQTFDVYAFYDAETVEEALEKMRRAVGKKHEEAAAVKFARTMLELWGERKIIENEAERKRLDLLNTYYKINAAKSQIQNAVHYASRLAGEVYNQYKALGGDHWEEEAYRTGKTRKEAIDEAYSKSGLRLIDTKDKQEEANETEAAAANV
jgi:hypothetical protein